MAEQDVLTTAREGVETFNSGDWGRAETLLTPDAIYEEPATGRRLQGREQILQAFQGWKQAFPDAKGTIKTAFAGGNRAVLEITWQGTQSGPLQGPSGTIPASRKQVTVSAVQVVTVEGGKIKENHQYFDMLGMLQQIGAMPR